MVDSETISIDPKKANGLHNWPQDLNMVREVQSILGVLSYQHPFIPHCANIAWPLTTLTKKGHLFTWITECRSTLDTLIKKVTNRPTLSHLDLSKPFHLQVDALAYTHWSCPDTTRQTRKTLSSGFLLKNL